MSHRDKALQCAERLREARFADADVVLLAGSIVRGEGTAYSDLDLVVLHRQLPHAYRESFVDEGFPVETFVHDLSTLRYFFTESDPVSGVPALSRMVMEGIEIPAPCPLSQQAKDMAAEFLAAGPVALSTEQLAERRYAITNLLDDLRDYRSRTELHATGAELYSALADYHLRSNGLWSAKNKHIPRVLARADAPLQQRFVAAFDRLFAEGNPTDVLALATDLLVPTGGLIFDGYHRDAPAAWRKSTPNDDSS